MHSNEREVLQLGAYEVGSGFIPTSVWIPPHHTLAASPQEIPWSFFIYKVKTILCTFLLRRKDKQYTLYRDLEWYPANIKDSANLDGRDIFHSSWIHEQGLHLHQCSWPLFPFSVTLPKGEERFIRVYLEEYFGVCSQPCMRLYKEDSTLFKGRSVIAQTQRSENVLFREGVRIKISIVVSFLSQIPQPNLHQ